MYYLCVGLLLVLTQTGGVLSQDVTQERRHHVRSAAVAPFAFPQLYRCPATKVSPEEHPRSQSNEDKWLYKNIFSKLPANESLAGTFVEIGALDGSWLSNTFYLEKKLDMRGILIEGHPANQPKLMEMIKSKRQNSVGFTNAICHLKDGHPDTLQFTNAAGATGTDINAASKEFLAGWHKGESATVATDCIPMQFILDTTNILDVDLFSLDVEGSEYAVLQTIDFSVTNFRVIVVELDGSDPEKDKKVRDLLESHGYENAIKTIGNIRSVCLAGNPTGAGCTMNEVYLNPNFMKRKRPKQYYRYGTSTRC